MSFGVTPNVQSTIEHLDGKQEACSNVGVTSSDDFVRRCVDEATAQDGGLLSEDSVTALRSVLSAALKTHPALVALTHELTPRPALLESADLPTCEELEQGRKHG